LIWARVRVAHGIKYANFSWPETFIGFSSNLDSRRKNPDIGLRIWSKRFAAFVLPLLIFGFVVLQYGGWLLIGSDPLPNHAEVAVALDGTPEGVAARFDAAMSLLEDGRVDHVMISVGKVNVWGKWFPDMVEDYVKGTFGEDIARRVALCQMNTDSTQKEADALRGCLQRQGWKSVVVVTSNYHSRRARHIWKRTFGESFTISVCGVQDGDFEPEGWWHSRRYAKTWLLETTKIFWTYVTGS